MLIQEYANDFHAKNMANQSKLQLSLMEMEQHNLFIYVIKKKKITENTTGKCIT